MTLEEKLKELDDQLLSWAIELGLPWSMDSHDILDRTGNWIGEFDTMDKTEQVVSLVNSQIKLHQKLNDAINKTQ